MSGLLLRDGGLTSPIRWTGNPVQVDFCGRNIHRWTPWSEIYISPPARNIFTASFVEKLLPHHALRICQNCNLPSKHSPHGLICIVTAASARSATTKSNHLAANVRRHLTRPLDAFLPDVSSAPSAPFVSLLQLIVRLTFPPENNKEGRPRPSLKSRYRRMICEIIDSLCLLYSSGDMLRFS